MDRTDVWITLSNGLPFHPWAPDPKKIHLHDIAHTLSQINRWGGHTRVPYSVAQHSVLVAERVPAYKRAWGLLHDATEAFMGGDIVSPIKRQIPELVEMEAGIARAIQTAFGLPDGALEDPEVKSADLDLLALEYRDLMGKTEIDMGDGERRWEIPEPMASRLHKAALFTAPTLRPWLPETAKQAYIDLARECGLERF